MNDYMRALHQRFFREPECADVRGEIENLRQELRAQLDRQDREKLLKLADLGIAGELEPYSFDDEEEERALSRMEREDR